MLHTRNGPRGRDLSPAETRGDEQMKSCVAQVIHLIGIIGTTDLDSRPLASWTLQPHLGLSRAPSAPRSAHKKRRCTRSAAFRGLHGSRRVVHRVASSGCRSHQKQRFVTGLRSLTILDTTLWTLGCTGTALGDGFACRTLRREFCPAFGRNSSQQPHQPIRTCGARVLNSGTNHISVSVSV